MFSLVQVTEHCCVELKDQDIAQEMRDRFEILKKKYPEVFSLNSQDIGCTNLVTMYVDDCVLDLWMLDADWCLLILLSHK